MLIIEMKSIKLAAGAGGMQHLAAATK